MPEPESRPHRRPRKCADLGREVLIDRDAAAAVGFEPGRCQIQFIDVALPPTA